MILLIGYNPESGKPIPKSYYFKTQKEAVESAKNLYKQDKSNIVSPNIKFKEWADKWLETKKQTLKSATTANYEYALKFLLPSLGKLKVRDIKLIHL